MEKQQHDLSGLKKFAALDPVGQEIFTEVSRTDERTKDKFLEAIRLIKEGMEAKSALIESGFAEAYLSQKNAPEAEPASATSGA